MPIDPYYGYYYSTPSIPTNYTPMPANFTSMYSGATYSTPSGSNVISSSQINPLAPSPSSAPSSLEGFKPVANATPEPTPSQEPTKTMPTNYTPYNPNPTYVDKAAVVQDVYGNYMEPVGWMYPKMKEQAVEQAYKDYLSEYNYYAGNQARQDLANVGGVYQGKPYIGNASPPSDYGYHLKEEEKVKPNFSYVLFSPEEKLVGKLIGLPEKGEMRVDYVPAPVKIDIADFHVVGQGPERLYTPNISARPNIEPMQPYTFEQYKQMQPFGFGLSERMLERYGEYSPTEPLDIAIVRGGASALDIGAEAFVKGNVYGAGSAAIGGMGEYFFKETPMAIGLIGQVKLPSGWLGQTVSARALFGSALGATKIKMPFADTMKFIKEIKNPTDVNAITEVTGREFRSTSETQISPKIKLVAETKAQASLTKLDRPVQVRLIPTGEAVQGFFTEVGELAGETKTKLVEIKSGKVLEETQKPFTSQFLIEDIGTEKVLNLEKPINIDVKAGELKVIGSEEGISIRGEGGKVVFKNILFGGEKGYTLPFDVQTLNAYGIKGTAFKMLESDLVTKSGQRFENLDTNIIRGIGVEYGLPKPTGIKANLIGLLPKTLRKATDITGKPIETYEYALKQTVLGREGKEVGTQYSIVKGMIQAKETGFREYFNRLTGAGRTRVNQFTIIHEEPVGVRSIYGKPLSAVRYEQAPAQVFVFAPNYIARLAAQYKATRFAAKVFDVQGYKASGITGASAGAGAYYKTESRNVLTQMQGMEEPELNVQKAKAINISPSVNFGVESRSNFESKLRVFERFGEKTKEKQELKLQFKIQTKQQLGLVEKQFTPFETKDIFKTQEKFTDKFQQPLSEKIGFKEETKLTDKLFDRTAQKTLVREEEKFNTKQEMKLTPIQQIIKIPYEIKKPHTNMQTKQLSFGKSKHFTSGFDVLLRRRGEFLKVTQQPLPKQEAIAFGITKAKGGLGATFKLKESTRRVEEAPTSLKGYQFLNQFYQKGVDTYIQKAKHRLGTLAERAEIKAARRRWFK